MAPGPFTLAYLAERTGAIVEGDAATLIRRASTLRQAGAGDIAFLANSKYRAEVAVTAASAVIIAPPDAHLAMLPRLVHQNPYACFAQVAQLLDPHRPQERGIHPSAQVARTARLGRDVSIGAFAVVGEDAQIGDGSVVYPHATLYPRVRIGRNAVVHAQAVIGSHGFGFAAANGRWIKVPQTGSVIVGDDVEIGAGTTIDCGALDDTVVGDGVKLDNQIQVGHNVHIGAHTAMAGCVGIAGSARIGSHCTVGGGAVILGHLTIVDHVNISAGALITRSIAAAGTYGGAFPFGPQREWLRSAAHLRNIDALVERVAFLEKHLLQSEKKA